MSPLPPLTRLERRLLLVTWGLALVVGTAAAWYYASQQLTLSHYDAKAHLVVARRVFDSLTPGWKQVGAVWLPLPHLLNMLPVQVDALYRTGLSGVALSVGAFALAAAAIAWMVHRLTGSVAAAGAATVVLAGDPNVLYLQATPMTEPLLFAMLAGSAASLLRWGDAGFPPDASWRPGLWLALACLTRYEAWPVTAALLGVCVLVAARSGLPLGASLGCTIAVARWPLAAVLLFLVHSRVSTDAWFVSGDFYVPENDAHGRPLLALSQVGSGLVRLVGKVTTAVAALGVAVTVWRAVTNPRGVRALLPLALGATAALPWYAFVQGHPFRIRYMVVLTLLLAVSCGLAVAALPRRVRAIGALLVALISLSEAPPFDATAAMVTEAQWDRPSSRQRQVVTECLARDFDRPREKILASMGSLAHYMQELSLAGFRLDDFVHEGTDDIWPDAVDSPRRHVQWILFEEAAEGGDVLTARRRRFVELVDGFERVCEGGGVALYRKTPRRDIELGPSPSVTPAPR